MGVGFLGLLRSIESAYVENWIASSVGPSHNALPLEKAKTLDPGVRRDDVLRAVGLKAVIPAHAGIQRLSLCTS